MKVFRSLAALALLAVLAACAASGPKLAEIQSAIPKLKPEEGRIFFYRKSSMMGAAIQPSIKLNGNPVGTSKPGGFFYVDTAPGAMTVSTSTEVERNLTFTLEAGKTRYVRTVISMGVFAGHVQPELVDAGDAEKELADTAYIGQPLK